MIHCHLPIYVPRIYSFTTSQEIKKLEKGLRYESAKERNERMELLTEEERKRNEEIIATYGTNDTVPSTDGLKDTVVYPPHTVCAGTQTELTAMDIAALEADYQQRVKECSQVRDVKGHLIKKI